LEKDTTRMFIWFEIQIPKLITLLNVQVYKINKESLISMYLFLIKYRTYSLNFRMKFKYLL